MNAGSKVRFAVYCTDYSFTNECKVSFNDNVNGYVRYLITVNNVCIHPTDDPEEESVQTAGGLEFMNGETRGVVVLSSDRRRKVQQVNMVGCFVFGLFYPEECRLQGSYVFIPFAN